MNDVQKAIFPAMLIGAFVVIALTRLLADPQSAVMASALLEEAAPAAETATDIAVEEPEPEPAANSGCQLAGAYPEKILRWCDWIQQSAGEHGLDPNLIAAVMLQESGGNPDAYSRSGAVGLMQVMPRDGLAASFQCINGPCFASRPSMDELFEPQFNIAYGVRMLAGLINRKGDVREGLRSYGPMDTGYSYADKVLVIYQRYQ